MSEARVHVIDLSGSEQEVAAAVLHACTTTGFFYVSNHGVDESVIAQHWLQNKAFFTLPLKDKLSILTDSNNRGYTPMAEETLDPEHQTQGDTKEGLYFGRDVSADSEEAKLPLHGPNQWPSEELLPGYRDAMQAYMDAVTALARRLLRIIAIALTLPPDFFLPQFDKPLAFLRPLHYSPQVSIPEEGVYGAGAHTDYGMLTVLVTDGTPGLQIHADGNWNPVQPIPGTFIINLGDMLERWTNGIFRSTLHRVVNNVGKERYSTAFFFDPNFDTKVECLPQCCRDEPAKYSPTTAGQHVLDMYAQTHSSYSGYTGPTMRVAQG